MKVNVHAFNHDVNIYNLGDVHRGDEAFNYPVFKKVVDQIRDDPLARWVSTGDLLNVALKDSLSSVYNSLNIEREISMLREELESIREKCLGFVASNHHDRFDRAVGMSLDKLLAELMDIPFLGKIAVIKVTCGRASYFIAMGHGTGGGKMRGGKANNLERFAEIVPGADIYLEGHTHCFEHFTNLMYYLDRKRDNLVTYHAHFVTTGHFLDWDRSYAMGKKYKPSPLGAARLRLKAQAAGNHSNKRVRVDLAC